jgi:hypothetical protein
VWTTEAIVRDLVINLIAGLAAGIFIFIVGLYWRRITSYLSRERAAFRRLFGENTWNTGILTVTLDTYKDVRILAQQDQEKIGVQSSNPQTPRFFKIFPDSHVAAFPGAWGDVLGYCSARAAAYLSKRAGDWWHNSTGRLRFGGLIRLERYFREYRHLCLKYKNKRH